MAELTLKQMAEDLAEVHGITKKKLYSIFKDIPVIMSEHAKTGEPVSFGGLFKMKLVERKARTGRNPSTGETISIPAKQTFSFKAGKNAMSLKDKVE